MTEANREPTPQPETASLGRAHARLRRWGAFAKLSTALRRSTNLDRERGNPLSDDFIVKLTTNPFATWYIRKVASKLDPILFKATNGRFSSMGPPAMR